MTSLEDRISRPDEPKTEDKSASTNGTSVTTPPSALGGSSSWADETSLAAEGNPVPATVKGKAEKEMSQLSEAQTDGATEPFNGSSGIFEPSYEVDVKLSDMQANPNDPLFSIKSFEELGL